MPTNVEILWLYLILKNLTKNIREKKWRGEIKRIKNNGK